MIPLAELAKVLVLRHGFSVTFISVADPLTLSPKAHEAFLQSLPAGIDPVTLSCVDLPDDLHIRSRITLTTSGSLGALRGVVQDLKQKTRFAAFVVDLFGTDCIDLAKEVGVHVFVFFTSNLLLLSVVLHLPRLHDSKNEIPDPWELPGCVPLRSWELPDQIRTWKGKAFDALVRKLRCFKDVQGILVNTFQQMEPAASAVFAKDEPGRPPVYLVGPMVHDGSGTSLGVSGDEVLKWLDKQLN